VLIDNPPIAEPVNLLVHDEELSHRPHRAGQEGWKPVEFVLRQVHDALKAMRCGYQSYKGAVRGQVASLDG